MLREAKAAGDKNIVIECGLERLYDVLLQAQQVGLMGAQYSYIITSLVIINSSFNLFKYYCKNYLCNIL